MTEKTLRKFAFWMFVVFVPVALLGGLFKAIGITGGMSSVLIVLGLIGAMLGLIVLKIAGPPKTDGE